MRNNISPCEAAAVMVLHHMPLQSDPTRFLTPVQRRATVRYRCPPATLGQLFLGEGQSLQGWVLNLSPYGVGLLLPGLLEPGQGVSVELESLDRETRLEVSAHIVHATPQADGRFLVGCAFAQPLAADELDPLL